MVSGAPLFLSMFNNLAIFFVLVISYGVIYRKITSASPLGRQITFGIFFGFFAISCMYVKIPVANGVIVDQRNTIAVLSAVFGGPFAGILCIIMAGAYRAYLGGAGVLAGITGLSLSFLAGLIVLFNRKRIHSVGSAATSALFATLFLLPGFLLVGDLANGIRLLQKMALPYGSAVFLGIFLVGLLLENEERRFKVMLEKSVQEQIEKQKATRRQQEAQVITSLAASQALSEGDILVLSQQICRASTQILAVTFASTWTFTENNHQLANTVRYTGEQGGGVTSPSLVNSLLYEEFLGLKEANYLIADLSEGKNKIPEFSSSYLVPQHCSSCLICLVRSGERLFGLLCFEVTEGNYYWTDDVISFGCHLADQLALAHVNRERLLAREEQMRLLSAIEQSGETFIITEADGRIIYVNAMYEKSTGYSRDEVLGQHWDFVIGNGHQNDNNSFIIEMLAGGQAWRGRLSSKRKDGSDLMEEAVITPVLDINGTIVNYVVTKLDITNTVAMERQLIQAQKVESIGRLAGGVAHDLNNLLSPILGYSELLLLGQEVTGTTRERIEQIQQAGSKARDMVRQLLAFSRNQTLAFTLLDINDILTSFKRLLRRTIPEDIDIELLLSDDLGLIEGDCGQIEQVIMNLVVNGAEAMAGGGKLIIETAAIKLDKEYCRVHQNMEPGNYVMLAISDTGHGMEEEIQTNIFEPFFSTKGERGTGLGLATVYGIVKQHGGNITVYSEVGQGTTFKVFFPVSDNVSSLQVENKSISVDLNGSETILIVEDNPQVCQLAKTILEEFGYSIHTAVDGPAALQQLAETSENVDLLLTDVVLPKMNGKELYEALHAIYPEIKVLFMSGYTAGIIAHKGVLDHGIEFIHKPFSVADLARRVREVLDS